MKHLQPLYAGVVERHRPDRKGLRPNTCLLTKNSRSVERHRPDRKGLRPFSNAYCAEVCKSKDIALIERD